MKIGVISLGCAKNLVDTENLLGILQASDLELTTSYDEADAIIINTCGFIEPAKVEAIDTILETAQYKENNLKKLIVMGCLAQRYKKDLEEEMPEVDRFISIDEYGKMNEILSEELNIRIPNLYGKTPRKLSGKPWMAYLRIADGCDNRCSYCAIPLIRGSMRSFPQEELVEEAKRLVQSGVKELNIIAQDSSRYGYDWDQQLHLSSLLKELDEIAGIHWIRILYLYPDEIPDDLIETIKQSKHILPYFDIPIQHGSNRMLKAMHRRSSEEEIRNRVALIRESFAHPVLRTTIMTGFPGETEDDHQRNLDLIRELKWDHLGVFTYSKEEDTPSYELEDDVEPEEKQKRKLDIMKLQGEIVKEKQQSLIGEEFEVLVEEKDLLTNMYLARSYLQAPDGVDGFVRFQCEQAIPFGSFVKVRIKKVSGSDLIGDYLEDE